MGALAKWDPEDDILLKNAVETGASLESLAKGAVNFTKRFTLKELQDRWRSLLYDPVISAEASARIIEVEADKTDPNPNPNPNMNLNQPCNKEKDVSQLGDKRKRDTVRSRYYSMRKRVSSCQPLETASMSGFVNNLENELQAYDNTDNNLGNELQPYDYQDNSIINNNNDHIAPFLSEEASMGPPFEDYGEDLLMSPKICPSLEDDNKNLESETSNKPGITFRDPDPIWRSMQREKEQEVMSQSKSNEEDVVPNTEEISDFMDFSMDFSLPNDLFIDDKDIVDTSCSMFLNSPQDEAANNMLNNITGTQGDEEGNDVINNNNTINNIVINNNTEIGNLVSDMGELVEKSSVCMLNTEDPDIPDNDDVCFDAVPSIPNPNPNPNPEYNSQTNNQNCEIISSSAMQVSAERKGITGDLIEIKAGDPLVPVPVPATMELPNAPIDPSILSKKEGFVPLTPLIRTTSGSHECSTNPVPVQTFNEPNPRLKEDHTHQVENPNDDLPENGDNAKYCTISGPNGCTMETGIITDQGATSAGGWVPLSDSDLDPLLASDNEEEKVFEESENDVPSFSDVEAMILEMDLSPYDQESLLSKESMRFHSAEKRKSLIRLEQGARSYMNRAIMSRGSFAVLYGRHMKYFIKSPEVSIGRKTEDIKVDIDLGMEGPANKISRRQAIIKLDENGSFHIKNIGKCAIFVNSKEVPAKKRINLTSGALIEIRDMRFIFEVNEKAVGLYTFAMGRTCESQHNLGATYEWVPLQNL